MSEFKVSVVRLAIEEHPNADALELAVIGGYRAIVRKGQYQDGDLAVYIPEQAVLPQWLVKELGLEGKLAGKKSDRVKAIKLRGVLSQGLVYPVQNVYEPQSEVFLPPPFIEVMDGDERKAVAVSEGDDVTDVLGIVKWEPPIPVHMAGQVWNASGKTVKFDIENWKNHTDVIQEGEQVVFTEKAHGTFAAMGIQDHTYIVYSKGLGAKGLAFKLNAMNNQNLYVRYFNEAGQALVDELTHILDAADIFVFGEIFGKGVQDLHYGLMNPTFRVFDIYVGTPNEGRYLNSNEVRAVLSEFEARLHDGTVDYDGYSVEYMPVLYEGPFSEEVMREHTDGPETISGKNMHIREGIVMRLAEERTDPEIGRVILKSVSADYLTRKGGTEYN
jgi:RNA ligase (TIGR02306 family)